MEFGHTPYHVVLGDLVRSRRLEDRDAAQDALQAALRAAEKAFRGHLSSPLQITGGDEFKGVVQSGRAALEVATFLSDTLHPLRVRFGIGYGLITVGRRGGPPGAMDGPAFHAARDALDAAKKRDHWIVVQGHGGRLGPTADAVVNAAFALTGNVRDRWTDTQRTYIRLVSQTGTQKDAAARAGVSASTVSESLRSADWREVSALEEEMKRLLDGFKEVPDVR